MHNDVSFLLADEMSLYEQQSTYNPNMPIRMLQYAGQVYERYIKEHRKNRFGKTLIHLPTPKLVVFYNESTPVEPNTVLHLSDSFSGDTQPDIKVHVHVVDLNGQDGQQSIQACQPLQEYAWTVNRIRYNIGDMDALEAADEVIRTMPENFVIRPYLLAHKAEVIRIPQTTHRTDGRTYANGLTGEAAFLPTTRAEMERRGWEQCDFVYVCGDAYVDHPSFGCAIITRLLEAHGFKVGIIAQPDWRDPASITIFGEPRLGFMVSAGNMDSMVNHYTVAKRRRSKDFYSPGGQMGLRPDRACVVYGNLIRRTYKKTPIILGGIEASLRRLAHYDYWSDSLKRSVLLDAGADIISYGMGEHSIIEIAEALDSGLSVQDLSFIQGTVYRSRSYEQCDQPVILPTFEQMQADKTAYARSFGQQYRQLNPFLSHALVEEYPHGVYVIQNPPSTPLTTEEFDAVYELPYARSYHPSYEAAGGIPAIAEIKFSLTSNRGCLGECAFCALNFHQGRIIQSRSDESLIAEATLMTHDPEFKGYIHDVGGPTANFRVPACQKQLSRGACTGRRCLSPEPCKNLTVTHKSYVKLLRKLRALPGVKKVFVRSGIRFDYALLDKDHTFIRELAQHHTSGQLRLAPEHVSDEVLHVMGKPSNDVYQRFCQEFQKLSRQAGKEQYVVPYLMSSHPGSTMKVAVELAEFCRDLGYMPEQVSDFYPTPSTVSTCIYYTGLDPRTMKRVYCPTNPHEKAMQRALIQYRDPKNRKLVLEALHKAGREDLIGYGPKCLVRPEKDHKPTKAKASPSKKPRRRGRNS